MKKTISKALALALAAALALSGCGSKSGNENTAEKPADGSNAPATSEADNGGHTPIKDLVLTRSATAELETFNTLYSQRGEDTFFLTNLWDGLLESNPKGELVPCLAEKWESPDNSKTWIFTLRDGLKWVDMNGNEKADNTSADFASGLEWVLNFHKNDSTNTSMPIEMIEGAGEYYEWTKTLDKEEALALTAQEGSKFREMVGLETPDEKTVVYNMIVETPYFPSVATYGCLYPISQAMIDELGGPEATRAMNNENMWYNGCYTMTSYIHGNEKILTKNPLYWDTEAQRFDTVTFKMVESGDITKAMFEAGDCDYCSWGEASLTTIYNDPNNKLHDYLVPDVPSKYAYQYHFNWDKKNEDGTPDNNWNYAIANLNFRKAWRYGLDLTAQFRRSNMLDPMACESNFYTMKGLCRTSDGTDYTELVRKELGLPMENHETPIRLDKEKFAEAKKAAMEELTALGVTFPVKCAYYIPGSNQVSLDAATVLKNTFTESFGDDFIVLDIKTYVSSQRNEVIVPKLFSITNNGWGADYGDPLNFLGQERYGNDNAYYSENYSFINDVPETEATKDLIATYKEFTKMVDEAATITGDMDARYAAFAKAEAYLLDNVITLPSNYASGWASSNIDNTSRTYALFGGVNDKMKNWRTSVDGYTTEEALALAAEAAK